MGTNYYYIKFTRCKECGNVSQEDIHIGKSSIGWRFHFHYEAFEDPKNWKEELQGKYIHDDYGTPLSYNDFLEMVENKQSVMTETEELLRHKKQELQMGLSLDRYKPLFIEGYSFYKGEFS